MLHNFQCIIKTCLSKAIICIHFALLSFVLVLTVNIVLLSLFLLVFCWNPPWLQLNPLEASAINLRSIMQNNKPEQTFFRYAAFSAKFIGIICAMILWWNHVPWAFIIHWSQFNVWNCNSFWARWKKSLILILKMRISLRKSLREMKGIGIWIKLLSRSSSIFSPYLHRKFPYSCPKPRKDPK